jgi:hypothetical protein
MSLLSFDDIEEMKEINKKLQGKRLACGPIDDIGPLDITIDDTLCDYREHDAEEILRVVLPLLKVREEDNDISM